MKMSNPYNTTKVVKCETCDREVNIRVASRMDGPNEDYYLCDQCMYGWKFVKNGVPITPMTDDQIHEAQEEFINSFSR